MDVEMGRRMPVAKSGHRRLSGCKVTVPFRSLYLMGILHPNTSSVDIGAQGEYFLVWLTYLFIPIYI